MKSLFAAISLSVLLLFANNIVNGRKDLGEYWRGVMKDQPMPEAIQGLIRGTDSSSTYDSKTNYKTNADLESKKKKSLVMDFEPENNLTAYHDDANLKKEEKSFDKDIEPRPNASAYGDDVNLKEEEKSFDKDFEPRPNASTYSDDESLKEGKSFEKDIEPRPNISAYGNDETLTEVKSFIKNI